MKKIISIFLCALMLVSAMSIGSFAISEKKTDCGSECEFYPTIIIPGLGTSLDALTNGAALLSSVSLQAPPNVLGTNTMECIQSGMIFGTACMLDGLCDRIEEEIGEACTVIATGGLAGMVVEHCRRKVVFSDTLLLDGLKIIWDKHR